MPPTCGEFGLELLLLLFVAFVPACCCVLIVGEAVVPFVVVVDVVEVRPGFEVFLLLLLDELAGLELDFPVREVFVSTE
jgi:hypothetical protein